ncbi:hypothetical protein ID866_6960 [Astraeus odoratus]|nr:hypothetical protein ID866_6960 [Astraeus odoratus]
MSSARRQPSTTSLAKYARSPSTGPDDYVGANGVRSLDFCNAFWGVGDAGVDVLFARMRGAGRTMEELKNFWKERAAIEEDYSKRLAKLAKMTVGKDEIGELRNSIDTLRLETDKQAGCHMQLAHQIRADLENQAAAFVAKQQHHKKMFQAAIEKEIRVKQTREQHASKAREKYESDCVRINSYTAQSTLVQGKDLEKIHLKLERAQQTVQVNENDYAQFTRVLQETMQKWEQDWKAFCDSCQDLEEERMEFVKDNMWAYANAVSTVCVSDDESCEKMRLALEQMEPDKEMENFVRDYSTGNSIPEPPPFINYANTDAPPFNSNRIVTRPAAFPRISQRVAKSVAVSPQDEEPPYGSENLNHAGVGAGGGPPAAEGSSLTRNGTHKSASGRSQANGVNGHVSPPIQTSAQPQPQSQSQQQQPPSQQRRNSTASMVVRTPSQARSHAHSQSYSHPQSQTQSPTYGHGGPDPIDPSVSSTQLVIGNKAWPVDPSRDPQLQKPGSSSNSQPHARKSPPASTGDDPLVKQMADLSTAAAAANGPGRKNTVRRDASTPSGGSSSGSPSLVAPGTFGTTAGPSNSTGTRDYRNSAEGVVGSYPLAQSRSASPNPVPPKAVMAVPPPALRPGSAAGNRPSTSNVPVEQIVENYQRPFPGQPRSRANSYVGTQPALPPPSSSVVTGAGQSQSPGPRPTSRAGYPGIGTTSFVHDSNPVAVTPTSTGGIGPGALQPYNTRPGPLVPAGSAVGSGSQHNLVRGGSVSYSPHPQQQGQQQQQQQRPVTPSNPVGIALGPDGRVVHDDMAAAIQYHRPSHSGGSGYGAAPPPSTSPYGGSAGAGYGDARMGQVPPPSQAPRDNYYGAIVPAPAQRPPSAYGHYEPQHSSHYGAPPPQHQQPHQQIAPPPPPSAYSGPPHPPTGSYTDDGRPILFYVKALYDYTATIDEEFDFQAGDIIAVTETPEDGWWSGELLDEARKQPGRHVFPSNFVCLF